MSCNDPQHAQFERNQEFKFLERWLKEIRRTCPGVILRFSSYLYSFRFLQLSEEDNFRTWHPLKILNIKDGSGDQSHANSNLAALRHYYACFVICIYIFPLFLVLLEKVGLLEANITTVALVLLVLPLFRLCCCFSY